MSKLNKLSQSIKKVIPNKSIDGKPNYFIWIVIGILIVPTLLFGSMLLQALENTGEPIVGDRFKDELDPEISEDLLAKLNSGVKIDGAKVTINLKSATLRVMVDLPDDASTEAISNAVLSAYDQVDKITPIATYFTNKEEVKMYDIEVHGYNFVESTPEKKNTHIVKFKTGAAKEPGINNMSVPTKEEVSNALLNPADPKATQPEA
ncbi:MAG: hypothetical protein RR929_05015 [Erysipelotrichaceae bacterium]